MLRVGWRRPRSEPSSGLKPPGLATNDVRLLSSELQTIGQSWLQETDLYRAMTYQLFGTRILTHHRVGIAAQEASYYVDLRNEFTTALGANQTLANVGVAHAYYQASAMEHGVLEQMQHVKPSRRLHDQGVASGQSHRIENLSGDCQQLEFGGQTGVDWLQHPGPQYVLYQRRAWGPHPDSAAERPGHQPAMGGRGIR